MKNCEFKNDNFYSCTCYRCWEKRNWNTLYPSYLTDEEEEAEEAKAQEEKEAFKALLKTPVNPAYFAASQNIKWLCGCFARVLSLVNEVNQTNYLAIYGLEEDKEDQFNQAIKIVFHKRQKNLLQNLKYMLKYNMYQ